MKKTLVALAVAAVAATSANAATVYEAEGTKIELSGSLRLYLGRLGDDQRGDLVNDGSRLKLNATHQLGNGLSVLGHYELRFNEGVDEDNKSETTFSNPTTKKLYAGFAHENVGTLTFGRQATNADDVLQDSAYYNSAALSPLTTDSDKSIKFRSAEVNGFSFGVDYLFGNAAKTRSANSGEDYKQGYAAAVFYNYELGDHKFNFAGVYAQDKYDGLNNDITDTFRTYTTWATHLGYNYGPFDLGLNYGQYKNKFERIQPFFDSSDISTSKKGNYILVDAGFRVIEPSRVYVQWERIDGKKVDNISVISGYDKAIIVNRYIAGVDYKFHKNVVTYVEYAHQRAKVSVQDEVHRTDKDNVFGVGLRVFF